MSKTDDDRHAATEQPVDPPTRQRWIKLLGTPQEFATIERAIATQGLFAPEQNGATRLATICREWLQGTQAALDEFRRQRNGGVS